MVYSRKKKNRLKQIHYILFLPSLLFSSLLQAQSADALIRKGNRSYKASDFDQSKASYEKALKLSPANPNANFNLGNAEFRKNNFENAAASFDQVSQSKADPVTRESAFYNKGVSMIKQKKLEESIDAWKDALRLNPEDAEARENLVKALLEKKKQDQQQQQNNKKDKQDKKPKEDKQNKQQPKKQEENHPKPQQSKLSRQQVEQYLKSLTQREKDVQDKMNQSKTREPNQPDKDW